MAKKSKKNYVKMSTPVGVAQWPHLSAPDTQYDVFGSYSVKLVMSKDDAGPILRKCKEVQEAIGNDSLADLPYKKDEKTGDFILNFKMKAGGMYPDKTTWEAKPPPMFDAKGTPMKGVAVGAGSKIKVRFQIYDWDSDKYGAGVTLQPLAIQVLDLVEYQSSTDASDFGFEAEEGYTGDGFTSMMTDILIASPVKTIRFLMEPRGGSRLLQPTLPLTRMEPIKS